MGRYFLAVGFPVWDESGWQDIPLASLFQDVEEHNRQVRGQLRPGKDDTFMLARSRKDADAGFCTQPLTHAQLLHKVQGQPVRLIPRCVITQSSGKQRIIDNADVGGQCERSSDPNKLTLCSPIRPAQHVAVAMNFLEGSDLSRARKSDSWEGGGEDWPEAYRHCPMCREGMFGVRRGFLARGVGGASVPAVHWSVVRLASCSNLVQQVQPVRRLTYQVRHSGRIEPSTPSCVPLF